MNQAIIKRKKLYTNIDRDDENWKVWVLMKFTSHFSDQTHDAYFAASFSLFSSDSLFAALSFSCASSWN